MGAQGDEAVDVDPVTGLPTQAVLRDRVERALDRSRRGGPTASVAVLYIDLGEPTAVDELGIRHRDRVLVSAAKRISAVLRPGDTLARFEEGFAVLCERLERPVAAVSIAHRIDSVLRQPLGPEADDAELAATITISLLEPGTADPLGAHHDRLLVDDELRARVEERQRLVAALHDARDGTDLLLHYQPVVSLRTGRISGVEALLRWRHGDRLVPPAEFVPLAEESGLVAELGLWVLRTAAEQVAQWQQLPGCAELRLAVNVSAHQLHDPELVPAVARVAAEVLGPGTLWLELTESLLIDELGGADGTIDRLVDAGARLSLDDFGTGYSSLSYLRRLPVEAVKLDRSFVAGVGLDEGDTAIVAAVLDLAAALGKECVAEGIESREQHQWLTDRDCAYGQGYFFSPPVDASALLELLQSGLPGQ